MLGKQAKILTPAQALSVERFISQSRYAVRNRVILLLSLKAGLRAKEIAEITWSMVLQADGELADCIRLEDSASKGRSGGIIPMAKDLREALQAQLDATARHVPNERIIRTCRSKSTSAQAIINLFAHWYRSVGLKGCSSHSGRRTFITKAARNIGRFGGSLRDVQVLARHSSLAMTQRYIEIDAEAMRKVVDA